eukprot:Sspe_Gene.85886::Locus_56642_Transcript_1_1_Confidence_1.000_Length_692::g.85886::m.85886
MSQGDDASSCGTDDTRSVFMRFTERGARTQPHPADAPNCHLWLLSHPRDGAGLPDDDHSAGVSEGPAKVDIGSIASPTFGHPDKVVEQYKAASLVQRRLRQRRELIRTPVTVSIPESVAYTPPPAHTHNIDVDKDDSTEASEAAGAPQPESQLQGKAVGWKWERGTAEHLTSSFAKQPLEPWGGADLMFPPPPAPW